MKAHIINSSKYLFIITTLIRVEHNYLRLVFNSIDANVQKVTQRSFTKE